VVHVNGLTMQRVLDRHVYVQLMLGVVVKINDQKGSDNESESFNLFGNVKNKFII